MTFFNTPSRQLLHALLYLLHPCSRPNPRRERSFRAGAFLFISLEIMILTTVNIFSKTTALAPSPYEGEGWGEGVLNK